MVSPAYYGLLLIATSLMASGFVVGKLMISAGTAPIPLVVARFGLASIVALIWLGLVLRRLHWPPTVKAWLSLIMLGSLQTALMFVMGFSALANLDAAMVALLTFTMPIWVVVIESAIERRFPSRWQIVGLIAGIFGVALLVGAKISASSHVQVMSQLGVLVGAFGWACAAVYTKRVEFGVHGWSLNAWQMSFGSILVGCYMLLRGESLPFFETTMDWLGILWLAIPTSVLAFGAWFSALRVGGVVQSSSYMFLVPLFTALMSVPFLGASFLPLQMAGGMLVGVAIWLMAKVPKPKVG